MADSPASETSNLTAIFLVNLITYAPASKSSKMKKRPGDKISKLKEANLAVTPTPEGYVEFLHALLAAHDHDVYKINEKKAYNFKYLYPPSKPYSTFFPPCSPKLTPCL